ncbi:MAG: hypothetical protein RLZZ546_1112, partial [Bacteroidota bacterium]
MAFNRRNFVQRIGLAATALGFSSKIMHKLSSDSEFILESMGDQLFNMSGYKAPKIEKVRVGFIGLGMRGPGAVMRLSQIKNVEIVALCDKYPDRVEKMQNELIK